MWACAWAAVFAGWAAGAVLGAETPKVRNFTVAGVFYENDLEPEILALAVELVCMMWS